MKGLLTTKHCVRAVPERALRAVAYWHSMVPDVREVEVSALPMESYHPVGEEAIVETVTPIFGQAPGSDAQCWKK